MATVYKTPGVYVEEIPKLPPSVAQVETAIPAFIGYTEKATEVIQDDLINKPKRISSKVDFDLYYGLGPSPNITEIKLDDNNNFISATLNNTFYLYDSIQMFYANGGGDCYIVSVGKIPNTATESHFTDGLNELEKEDEPTILLFPDAVLLDDNNFKNVQQAALSQCGSLQDRVAVLDLKQIDPKGDTFRSNIGINNLSYGAAYTPWLKVSLPKTIKYSDINLPGIIKRSDIVTPLSGLTSDAEIQGQITKVDQAYTDLKSITDATTAVGAGNSNLRFNFNSLEATFNANNNNVNLQNIFNYVFNIALQIDKYINGASTLTNNELKTDIENSVNSNFIPSFVKLRSLEGEAVADISGMVSTNISTLTSPTWDAVSSATASDDINNALIDDKKRIAALNILKPLFSLINRDYISLISNTAASTAKTLDDSLALSFPIYKAILIGVGNSMTSMPPSASIAGVYSTVDRTRGVWKAPANISLNNVIEPDTKFTKLELDNLNIDVDAGKSINAIRSFTGKGTLVFGARTLAGNDNEWRYISVRRFFNMVEESSKKATEPFVFENNDANTWVKVQAMLENFLTVLWRQGALQGAKPEQAFYVAVGLGKTMTALDILEGRMIIEIGMAVVRPAEFIILRFSHKMAES